ncbi:MAG: hypothetical protein CNLJKLNK_00168 [Holosporales bacterium]
MSMNKIFLTLLAFFAASPSFASAAAPACQHRASCPMYDMPLSIPGAYSIHPDRVNQTFFNELPRSLAFFLLNKDDNERESALYLYVYKKVCDYILRYMRSRDPSQEHTLSSDYGVKSFLTPDFQAIFGDQQEPIEKRIDQTLTFIVNKLENARCFHESEMHKEIRVSLSENFKDDLTKSIFADHQLNEILSLSNSPYPNAMLTKLMIVVNTVYFNIDYASLEVGHDAYIKILPRELLENYSDFMRIALQNGVINVFQREQEQYFLFNHLKTFKLIQGKGTYDTLVLGCGRFKKGDSILKTAEFGTEAFRLGLDQYLVSAGCRHLHQHHLTVARMPHIMPHIVADITNEYFIEKLKDSGLRFQIIVDEIGILKNNPYLRGLYEALLVEGGRITESHYY